MFSLLRLLGGPSTYDIVSKIKIDSSQPAADPFYSNKRIGKPSGKKGVIRGSKKVIKQPNKKK